jgi:hypothetical protein
MVTSRKTTSQKNGNVYFLKEIISKEMTAYKKNANFPKM